jgi:hypothetical protein
VNCLIDSSIGASLPQEYYPDALAAELTSLTFLILQFRRTNPGKKRNCDAVSNRRNYYWKVAMIADQLALPLSVKVAVYDPVMITSFDSFVAGEVDVSC